MLYHTAGASPYDRGCSVFGQIGETAICVELMAVPDYTAEPEQIRQIMTGFLEGIAKAGA